MTSKQIAATATEMIKNAIFERAYAKASKQTSDPDSLYDKMAAEAMRIARETIEAYAEGDCHSIGMDDIISDAADELIERTLGRKAA